MVPVGTPNTRGARNPQPTIIPYASEAMGPNRRMASFERTEYRAQTIPLSSRQTQRSDARTVPVSSSFTSSLPRADRRIPPSRAHIRT